MTHFHDLITEAVKPDVISESESGTFVGWFDRKEWNRSTEPEAQSIWKIRRITTTEAEGVTTTKIQYPEGRSDMAFKWNDRESYNYKYKC